MKYFTCNNISSMVVLLISQNVTQFAARISIIHIYVLSLLLYACISGMNT